MSGSPSGWCRTERQLIMTESTIQELSPFNFFVGHRSAIRPLGGPVQGPDPKYAFHTEYRECRPGSVVFRVVLDDLAISFGDLEIHLNAYVPNSGKNALRANGARISAAELQQKGGHFEISVYAVRGVTYGLYGFFPDGTDARASGITITVEEKGLAEKGQVPAEALEPTRFGVADFRQSPRLIENADPPSFADPVSQVMTAGQCDDPAFIASRSELSLSGTTPEVWRKAFILQVMKRYSYFGGGARGLCLGDQDADLVTFFADNGNPILFGFDPGRPSLLGSTDVPTGAFLSVAEMDYENIAADVRGFDFLWSVGTGNQMGGARRARAFVEQSMQVLRSGGLAIHVFDISSSMQNAPVEDRVFSDALLARDDIIRIAVMLISRSNEVAQLNFGDGDGGRARSAIGLAEAVPFGLIVRKGR